MAGARRTNGSAFFALDVCLQCATLRSMKRVAMFFSESQRQRLRALSGKTGLSVSELVRRAVDEFLERMKNDRRTERL